MKKTMILAAAAALVLASCAKTEITTPEEQHAIGFSSYAGRVVTKASTDSYLEKGATTFTASNQHIGVFAYMGAATTAKFMNNVDVTLQGQGATASNSYSPVRYWPKDETKPENALNFIAYYPYNATGVTGKGVHGDSNEHDKYGTLDITVQDNIANQVDVLYAEPVEGQYYSTNSGVVPFSFHHALTRVLFQVKTDDTYSGSTIVVNSLSISNIKKSGTLTLGASPAMAAGDTPVITYDIPKPAGALTTTAAPADEAANVFLLMPQDIEDAAKLSIQYTLTSGGVDTVNDFTIQLNTITDGVQAIKKWSMNQNVVYTIVIGLNPIKFTGTVADWDSQTTGTWTIN